MRDVLIALQAALEAAIPEAGRVAVVESEDPPRADTRLPLISLKDGGATYRGQPSHADLETGRIHVRISQAVPSSEPGTAVEGEANPPGVLELAERIRALLGQTDLGGTVADLHVDHIGASETGPAEGGGRMQWVRVTARYQRIVP